MSEYYDLAIIGRGAAGFSAAIKASEITGGQASIAMIGYGFLGGTCVNVGCVPSKILIEGSNSVKEIRHPRYSGIKGEANVDFRAFMESLRDAVNKERKTKYYDVIRRYKNIDVIDGKASFRDSETLEIRDGENVQEIRAYNFLIATGSRAYIPDIDGLNEVPFYTNENIWNINAVPDTMAIIGAGAIGLEIGQAFSNFGSRVTIIEKTREVMAGIDSEFSGRIAEIFRDHGIEVTLGASVDSVRKTDGKNVISFTDDLGRHEIRSDLIFISTGRIPNLETLSLENAGVEYSRKGIRTGEDLRTSNPRIYAAGDVVDQRYMLETLAAREGVLAAQNIYDHAKRKINMNDIPRAVFTEPQFASVGMNEGMCRSAGVPYVSRLLEIKDVPKARILGRTDGLVKIIAEDESGKILGMEVLSPYAAEIIVEGAYAIRNGLSYKDIVDMPHVFPTVSESIKITAQSFLRDISMMSCCME